MGSRVTPPARFCLVTSAHVSNNPRLVKEADALAGRGHDVRVVAVDVDAEAAARDDTLMRSRRWRLERVTARRAGAGVRASARWLAAAVLQRVATAGARGLPAPPGVRDRALSRLLGPLARRAAAERADVVVAHNLEALPAAARAARARSARLVFDAEDLHAEDVPDAARHAGRVALIRDVERRYLPRCNALVASSDGIATALAAAYSVARPTVVLNAFSPPPARVRRAPARGERQSLYWFSQTLGPGRGIEDAVLAVGMLRAWDVPVELHLRGAVGAEYRGALTRLAQSREVGDAVHLLPLAPPDEMVALAAQHDVGLALEQGETLNRRLCVTNKILAYLAAGIAVAATDTPAQRAVLDSAPGAGFVYRAGDASELASSLRALLATPGALETARAASADAASRRFSWERESRTLVATYEGLLASPPAEPAPRAVQAPLGVLEA